MIRRTLHVIAVVALSGAAATGCHHRHSASAPSHAVVSDSLTGTVSITGTSFEQQIVLRTTAGTRTLAATADDSASLAHLGGVEIVAYGAMGRGDRFEVARFTVLRVDGAPVADGTLVRDGIRLILRTAHGNAPLGNPPAELAPLVGARVWIGGPLDTGPNSYGVIKPPSR